MGISANLVVNARFNTREVTYLVKALGYEVVNHTYNDDHAFLYLKAKEEGPTEQIRLYIAKTYEYGGLDAVVISCGTSKERLELLRSIQKVTGGFLQESDASDDNWVMRQDPHAGWSRFVLSHHIVSTADADGEDLANKLKKGGLK